MGTRNTNADVGDPINIFPLGGHFNTAYELETDLSIPVKHGLRLEVKRAYSSAKTSYSEHNLNGFTVFGHVPKTGTDVSTNWHLCTYESRIVRISIHGAYGYKYLQLIEDNGNRTYFAFNSKITITDADRLYDPQSSMWGTSQVASVFYPTGDPRTVLEGPDVPRQTTQDLVLYIIHNEDYDEEAEWEPLENNSAAPWSTCGNIAGYVVRFPDGKQYHYAAPDDGTPCGEIGHTREEGGLVRFIDANWRNNVDPEDSAFVDDYLEIEHAPAIPLISGEDTSVVAAVKAPPSDGRELIFHHPNAASPNQAYLANYIDYVSLNIGDRSTIEYPQVIEYEYETPSSYLYPWMLRLQKVWTAHNLETGERLGIQYDYGLTTFTDGEPVLNAENYPYMRSICLKSMLYDAGETTNTSSTTPFMANVRTDWTGSDYRDVTQLFRDPDENVWREAFRLRHDITRYYDPGPSDDDDDDNRHFVFWRDGQIVDGDGSTRYTPDSPEVFTKIIPQELTHFNHVSGYKYSDATYGDPAANPPPRLRQTYYSNSNGVTELVDQIQQRMDNEWITLVDYDYTSPTTHAINQPTKITRYTEPGETETALVTEFAYTDMDNKDAPSRIDYPDGSRVVIDYIEAGEPGGGRPGTVTRQQWNGSSFQDIGTYTYSYIASGTNAGLPQGVEFDGEGGEHHELSAAYDSAGKLVSVTVDDRTTTYTFETFGHVTSVETETGTTEYAYTDETEYVPSRLVGVEDAAGNITALTYLDENGEDHNRVQSVTQAVGEDEETTTEYVYDLYGKVKQVSSPGRGPTTYRHSIYGKLLEMTDANDNRTTYSYDGWGRVVAEEVHGSGSEDPLYTVTYTYANGASCSCSGGGANQVASRAITKGEESETVFYKYDLAGRLVGIGTTEEAEDMVLAYGPEGEDETNVTRLRSVTHANDFDLYGDNTLKYEYDELNRLKRETYPNGRTIEFFYDAGNRLTAIKDPFGYVNQIAYDDENNGRLSAMLHSSLGLAGFDYDGLDRLTTLTLGNGAASLFGYDAEGRLDAFDLLDGQPARMLQHEWTFDPLNRKVQITADIPALSGGSEGINLEYDDASRVIRETFTNEFLLALWDKEYDYDDAENRTSMTPDPLDPSP